MDRLTKLPNEILNDILEYLYSEAARQKQNGNEEENCKFSTVTLVCKDLRELSLPLLFQSIRFTFLPEGFDNLKQLSESRLARLVKNVRYDAPLLLKPGMWVTLT